MLFFSLSGATCSFFLLYKFFISFDIDPFLEEVGSKLCFYWLLIVNQDTIEWNVWNAILQIAVLRFDFVIAKKTTDRLPFSQLVAFYMDVQRLSSRSRHIDLNDVRFETFEKSALQLFAGES